MFINGLIFSTFSYRYGDSIYLMYL